MGYFFKVFTITFLCFILMFVAGFYTYNKFLQDDENTSNNQIKDSINIESEDEVTITDKDDANEDSITGKSDETDSRNSLEGKYQDSDRVNFLLFGLEKNSNTDVILFLSIDPEKKLVDIISIPNNTYLYEKGFESGDEGFISNQYKRSGKEKTKNIIENILGGVPIDYYMTIRYNDVETIIDMIGGVEVTAPFDMKYEDITDNPPLVIDIKKGNHILNGEDSLKYLRWKNNNDNTVGYPDGDLGRVRAQQKFIVSAIKKSLNFNLPSIIKKTIQSIDTNMSRMDAINFSFKLVGIKMENIKVHILPGGLEAKEINSKLVSYYIHDENQTAELIKRIYSIKK